MGKRKNVSGKDLIANPEEALRRFAGHGVIKETGDIYSADKPRWEKEFDAYAEQFSELESLQGVIETNPWHDHDDAFTHTRNVYKNVVHDLQFTFVTNKEKRRALKEYFDAPFAEDFMTRAEGVKIAVMLHDITKSDPQEMTIEEGTGHTYFPTHHASGAQMASAILEGKQYTPAFVQRVRTLIGLHTQIHLMEDSSQRQARMEQIQANNPDIFPDLLILSMADMQGSDLAKLNVMDYEERMKDYITAFNNLHI